MSASRSRPGSHRRSKRDEHEYSGSYRRVYQVLTNTAKQLLNNDDRCKGANDGDFIRQAGRAVERQQYAGEHRTQVADSLRLFRDFVIQEFEQYAGCYEHSRQRHYAESELIDADSKSRQKCDKHRSHNLARICLCHHMRRR